MVGGVGRERRTPVSLRVPEGVAEAVERFAATEGVSKTEAYLYLIGQGLQVVRSSEDGCLGARCADRDPSILNESEIAAAEACKVRAVVAAVAAQFPAIERVYLFGSFAREAHTAESDIDLRLELDRGRGFNLRDLSHFMKLVQQQTGRECDVVTAADLRNAALSEAIEREKVLVYER